MSSTTNVQNLLVNVFRPVYRYEIPPGDSNSIFVPKLEMSNIDTYSGNSVTVQTVSVSDSNSNVYVGSNAGNVFSALKACRNNSAFGVSAAEGISNVSNSVFVGYNAGAGAATASSNVAIGANVNGNGNSNVRIGATTGLLTETGSSNVSIGTLTSTSTYSNCIVIGNGITATENNQFRIGASYIWGNQTKPWLGIGTPTAADIDHGVFDVSGDVYFKGHQGINMVPTRTLDVNGDFRASDANGTLDFHLGVTSSSNGFASIRGTTTVSGGATTIGVIKKGVILISAVNTSDSSKYAARHVIANTTSNLVNIGSNVTATVSITSSTSNIQLTDAGNGTYDWSITYFPL